MNVLLITPDHGNQINNFPWGVLSVGSYIKQKNKEVKILDASMYTQKEFKDVVDEEIKWAHIVGISFFSTDAPFITDITAFIKSRAPSLQIICGGPHAMLEPETTCRHANIDYVSYGEGEGTLDLLVNELQADRTNLDNVPGLIYKNGDRLIRTSVPQPVDFYDTNYELLSKHVQNTFHEYIQVLTGRGCSFRCTFCFNAIIKQSFRPRPVKKIIDEIRKIVKKYNPRVIYFRDENFFHDKNRIYDFIESYKENGFSFQWRATCRANYFSENYVNDELINELEQINCQTLKLGLESGSQRILRYIQKGITVASIKKATDTISRSNINGNYSLMIGIPTETYGEYLETLSLAQYIIDKDPHVELIGPQYFRLYPGGYLYNEVITNYNLIGKPQSLDEYADLFRSDEMGLNRDIDYPWISKKDRCVAKYAEYLCLLYRKGCGKKDSFKNLVLIPFYFLIKVRFKYKWFRHLHDVYIIIVLNNFIRRMKRRINHLRRSRRQMREISSPLTD